MGNGFYKASNACISVVKNQGSANVSTHTVSFCSLVALHFLFGSNALATVNRILNHASVDWCKSVKLEIWYFFFEKLVLGNSVDFEYGFCIQVGEEDVE